jgi:triacylglycerol lipase
MQVPTLNPSRFDRPTATYLAHACRAAYDGDSEAIKESLGLDRCRTLTLGDLFGFHGDTAVFQLLVFRGTATVGGWLTDFEAAFDSDRRWPGRVHHGFAAAFRKLASAGKLTISTTKPLWITGHSQGGAIATLASMRLTSCTLQPVYTFGSPRVGDQAFADAYTPVQYRVVNQEDPVPHVPTPLHFHHVGQQYMLDFQGNCRTTHSQWPEAREHLLHLLHGPRSFAIEAFKDHHIDSYINSLEEHQLKESA